MSAAYYALAYLTRTGLVLGEVPIAGAPTWTQMINDPGSWSLAVPVTGTGMPQAKFLEFADQEWKISVAICWGTGSTSDIIVQAGPWITTAPSSDTSVVATIGGTGFWGMLNHRLQVASTWPGLSVSGTGGADTTYGPTSYQGVAVGILNNAVALDTLPLDVPAAISGTVTMTYFGYDLTMSGQRLTELATTIATGPDILFKPYFSSSNTIRHQAIIGNPRITPGSTALYFDYPGAISSILPSRDASQMAGNYFVKGNGMEYATLWGSYVDPTLASQGWPRLDFVDNSQSSITDPNILNSIAQADDLLHGRSLETWAVRVRMDVAPTFGSYGPGVMANYNIQGYPFKRDGLYSMLLVGLQAQQGDPIGEVRHLLQATAGEI